MLANGHFNYCVSELDDDNVNMTTHYKKKVEMIVPRNPNKIGYNLNSSTTMNDVLYSSVTDSCSPSYQCEFINMSELEKLDVTYKYKMMDCNDKSNNIAKNIIKMKRQLKRRNKIGYFKGHDKSNNKVELL
jgi:hypothetical protein